MRPEVYKKMTDEDRKDIATGAIFLSKTAQELSDETGFPRRTISDFLARQTHKVWWASWDKDLGDYAKSLGKSTSELNIFIYDIETSPMLGYFWGLFKQNMSIDMIKEDWIVLTWAGKWFGEENIYFDSCWLHNYDPAVKNDRPVIQSLWNMFEQADMVVAHNGDKFDIRKVTARAIYHDIKPHSPVKQIDTMKIAKRAGAFSSNKLDWLARTLCGEQKIETGGFELWERCLEGDEEAWAEMLEYNINDVQILENVWVRLAPYDKKCPSFITHVDSEVTRCISPACGSHNVSRTGRTAKTTVSEFIGYKCDDCGKQMRGRVSIRSKEQREATLMNVL